MTTTDPFRVVRDFEAALCEYTGARYAVTVNSCTAALFLSFAWWFRQCGTQLVEIPARTYVSVPMVALQAGHKVRFVDEEWRGWYIIAPMAIIDSAPHFPRFKSNYFTCVSFHPRKPLGLSTGGGAILHDNDEADEWFRRMRFDGRTEGRSVAGDPVRELGWHCYMMPPAAAEGLQRLSVFRPGVQTQDEYPDLRLMPVFQTHPGVVR
jgi:dTDP-4-amino-4,6-dideoxygalactose transaminase